MTHKPPRITSKAEKVAMEAARAARRHQAAPLTLGDVLGEAVAADRAAKDRRRELDDMGFTPLSEHMAQ